MAAGRRVGSGGVAGEWAQPLGAGAVALAVAAWNKNQEKSGKDASGTAVLEAIGGAVLSAFSPPGGFIHLGGIGLVTGAISSMVFGA